MLEYRKEIDGLRSVAVVPVILFHAGVGLFSGGYVGVDIFFVISGYLITTLLLSDIERNSFSILKFYKRRARRILPALMLVLSFCLFMAWFTIMPVDMRDFMESVLAVSLFSSNILFWREAGYFDAVSDFKPLLHTWSLGVEEQYYIIFPPMLFLLWRFGGRWKIAGIMSLLCCSFAVAQWSVAHAPMAAFFLLPSRGWELLVGSVTAIYLKRNPPPGDGVTSHLLSLAGLVLIAVSTFIYDNSTPFPGYYALVPVIGTAMVILFAVDGTLANRLLCTKPLVTIGLISYSAYLWHQPLLVFARFKSLSEPTPLYLLAIASLSFPLAYLSWRFVELPFRKRHFLSRSQVFIAASGMIALFSALGLWGHYSNGFPRRSIVTRLNVMNYEPDNRMLQEKSWKYLRERSGDRNYGVEGNPYDLEPWFTKSPKKNVLLIGNSHSKDMYNTLIHSRDFMAHFEVARLGSQIRGLKPSLFNVPNYKAANIIVLVSRFDPSDFDDVDWLFRKVLNDGKKIAIVRTLFELPQYGQNNVADMIVQRSIAGGWRDPQAISSRINRTYFNEYRNGWRVEPDLHGDRKIDALKLRYPSIIVLNRMDYICNPQKSICYAIDTSLKKYFYGDGHNTLAGSAVFGKRIDETHWAVPLLKP
ncbi:acyltransferase family protein [Rhizorhapis suberifaciens]|uniref:acyltransferase family protein n=1 Tax=Rhizorhapis suberifaciens TaxID=13656 RepID=UPI002ADE668B|nr:acyltransferase [Rhizorhapis suberifaciens]